MLRRRHKTPKVAAPREGGTARTPRSRRRAREDAPVPPDLRIKPHPRAAPDSKPEPAKPQPQAAPKAVPATESPAQAKAHKPSTQPKPPGAARKAPVQPPRERQAGAIPPVLVTGFEPFDGDDANPSWDVCTRLPREVAGLRIETCRVPCEFRRAIEVVAAAIETHEPSLVLCLGLASGRTHMGVERVAINCDDARIPDNAGVQPMDQPVAAKGPPAYFATVPVKAMVAAMHERGVPAEVSNSAGTFVCNHLMYGVLHFLAASGMATRAGFIHVPRAEGMALDARGVASMSLATMARGVEAAIAAAHAHSEDIAATGGSLD
ncbi:MAG TPA: pyroglutamyl-peptidase I [Usitatibacter sp.]|jgi:pyroglutamyl-peptidase|nr:pyroglutamyl-peptidase I [Usitatibacter sp.]